MDFEIGNPLLAWLLLYVPLVAALLLYNSWNDRLALKKFGMNSGVTSLFLGLVSGGLLTMGISLLILACMDIRWGKITREVPQKGLEVVFALDVSRSMLATDAKPNRLARAKQQINDMVDEMAGDRIGLVVFAGDTKQAVPLTSHYHDFRQALETVGPDTVLRGGSQLGLAIEATAESFIAKTNDHKTMVLFTDGEDQESKPVELARQYHADTGLRIFTVGLGDFEQGARVPDADASRNQFLEHEGQQVWSKLNGSILKQIATETKAAYIPAGTKRVNMADVYHSYIANVEKAEFETARINSFVVRYQWFAFPAFILLALYAFVSTIRATPRAANTAPRLSPAKSSAAAVMLMFLIPNFVFAQSADHQTTTAEQINAANTLVRGQENKQAIEAFNRIELTEDQYRDELNYNLASAHYRDGNYDTAMGLFQESAKSANTTIASDSRYNLGNCHYAKALAMIEQPGEQQQADQAVGMLEQAIQHFRSALRIDRSRSNARENIERAKKLIQQLQNQEQQQNEQSQDQNQQNDQEQNQQEQNQQEQNQQNQDQQNQDQQNQDQQNQDQQNQDQQNQSENQQNNDSNQQDSQQQDQDEQGQQQSDQSKSDPPNADKSDQQNKPSDQKQDKNGEPENEGEQPQGSEAPKGDVTAANENETKEQKQQAGQPQPAGDAQPQKAGMLNQQEALKLLQSVRDRDMLRRLRQQQIRNQNRRRMKVDKDW